jgi:hydrogenase nickel incorporation protein HypA/HybF
MHELSIATEIHRACRTRIEAQGRGRLEKVRLAVGELSAVEPDLLAYAWEAVVAEGPDAGAVLDVEWRAARQVCESCGDVPERAAGSWLRLCPRCEAPLRVEGGDELDLLSFSFTPLDGQGGATA